MKRIILATTLVSAFYSKASFANFEGADVPTIVVVLPCDGNPRIAVNFADGSKNIWYPAKAPYANQFLSVALAAKTAGKPMYYYGMGAATDLTDYCINSGRGREVTIFGVK